MMLASGCPRIAGLIALLNFKGLVDGRDHHHEAMMGPGKFAFVDCRLCFLRVDTDSSSLLNVFLKWLVFFCFSPLLLFISGLFQQLFISPPSLVDSHSTPSLLPLPSCLATPISLSSFSTAT